MLYWVTNHSRGRSIHLSTLRIHKDKDPWVYALCGSLVHDAVYSNSPRRRLCEKCLSAAYDNKQWWAEFTREERPFVQVRKGEYKRFNPFANFK